MFCFGTGQSWVFSFHEKDPQATSARPARFPSSRNVAGSRGSTQGSVITPRDAATSTLETAKRKTKTVPVQSRQPCPRPPKSLFGNGRYSIPPAIIVEVSGAVFVGGLIVQTSGGRRRRSLR